MIIHKEIVSGTTSSGSYSDNTNSQIRGMLRQILVEPTTATTIYDITITNGDNMKVYERLSEQGILAEQVDLPMKGVYTLAINNATNDEAFTAQLWVEE